MAFQCYECHHKQGTCKYHESSTLYAVGEHESWPGVRVWLPPPKTIGSVSVGPCEDCREVRPCVNC